MAKVGTEKYVYAKISQRFWMGGMRRLSPGARYLMLYFLTNPHKNLTGFYCLPLGYALADTGLDPREFDESFKELKAKGSVLYDEESEVVLIPKYLEYNPLENDNQRVCALKKVRELPDTFLMSHFAEYLQSAGVTGPLLDFAASMEPLPEGLGKPLPKGLPEPLPEPLEKPLPEGLGKPVAVAVAVAVTETEKNNRGCGYVDNSPEEEPENQSQQGEKAQNPTVDKSVISVDNVSGEKNPKKKTQPDAKLVSRIQTTLVKRSQLTELNQNLALTIIDRYGEPEGMRLINLAQESSCQSGGMPMETMLSEIISHAPT